VDRQQRGKLPATPRKIIHVTGSYRQLQAVDEKKLPQIPGISDYEVRFWLGLGSNFVSAVFMYNIYVYIIIYCFDMLWLAMMEELDSRPCYVRILHRHPELFKVTARCNHTPYFSQRSSYKPMLGSCLIFYGNTADENSKASKSYIRLEDGQAIKAKKKRSIASFII